MIPLLLSAVLATVQSPVLDAPRHASLHPRESDLFVEVSDVPSLLEGWARAPIFQLVQDDAVRTALRTFGTDGGLVEAFASPEAFLDHVLARVGLVGDVDGLVAVSLSAVASGDAPSMRWVADFETGVAAGSFEELLGAHLEATRGGPDWSVERTGTRVIAQSGRNEIAATADDSYASSELLRRASRAFRDPVGPNVFWLGQTGNPIRTLLDVDRTVRVFDEDVRSVLEETSRLDTLGPLEPFATARLVRMQLESDHFLTETYDVGRPTSTIVLDEQMLALAPDGAMGVVATSMDPASLASVFAIGKNVGALAPLLGNLRGDVVAYTFPMAGLGPPRSYAWLSLKEPERYDADVEHLTANIASAIPGSEARTRSYRVRNRLTGDQTPFELTTLDVPKEVLDLGPFFSLSPSFCRIDDRLLVSLRSTDLKRELKRLFDGKDESEPNALVRASAADRTDAATVVVVDWNQQIVAAYELITSLAPLLGDLPVDLDSLPPAETFGAVIEPTIVVTTATDGASYSVHRTSFGPETWWAVGTFVVRWLAPARTLIDDADVPPAPSGSESSGHVR